MTRHLDSMGARLRFARKQRSKTQEQLAKESGEQQPNISKIERGETQETASIARLAASLGVSPLWLELGDGPEPDWSEINVRERTPLYVVTTASRTRQPIDLTATSRVPVIGILEMGADKMFEIRSSANGNPVGHVHAVGASGGCYAVRVFGDDLYPTVRHGACLVVDPAAQLVEGELVLAQMTDGTYLVAELVSRREDSITLANANGGQRRTLAASKLTQLMAVIAQLPSFRFDPL